MTCDQCNAACCRRFGIIEVTPHDTQVPADLTQETELGYRMMKLKPGTFECVALQGNRCSIYENRPTVCRLFKMGGDLCALARQP